MVNRRDSTVFWALLLAAALLGMALVFAATRYGPGVGGDATIYLTTARNLLAGKGLGWTDADGSYRLLPYTPPFYPLALSAVGLLASDMVAGARWLNMLLFGLTVFLIGWAFQRFTGRGWLALLLAGTLAASPVLVGVAVWAMSEPVFLFTGFAGLALLLLYFETCRRTTLFASALLVGLAFLARYAGAAFVATAGLALLAFYFWGKPLKSALRREQWRDLLLYALIAFLPMLVWLVVDFALTGTVASRSGQPAADYWQRLLAMCPALERIYLFWLLPESMVSRLPGVIRIVLWLAPLLAVSSGGWLVWRKLQVKGSDLRLLPGARLALLMAGFIIMYLLVLTVVQVFTYPPVTLASRMLSPVHLAALVLVFALLHLLLSLFNPSTRGLWNVTGLVYLLALGLFASYALRGALVARDYYQSGIGYTAPSWQSSQVMDVARGLPGSVVLISNDVTALMFLADRPAYTLQETFQDRPQETFTVYGQGADESQRVFREEGGALVLFNESLRDDFGMYGEQVEERLVALTAGLYLFYQGEDGAIYFYERPAFAPQPEKH